MVKDKARAYRTMQTGQRQHITAFFSQEDSWNCSPDCPHPDRCPCWCHTTGPVQKVGRSAW